MLPVPVLTPSLSSHWIRFVTRADYTIARKLVDDPRDMIPVHEDGKPIGAMNRQSALDILLGSA